MLSVGRSRPAAVIVTFTILGLIEKTSSLICYDGSHCDRDYRCSECEGVACLRIVRQPFTSDYHYARASRIVEEPEIAMTCLPGATRNFDLEPAGCRTNPINNVRTCVCYDHDHCNSAPAQSFNALLIISVPTALAYFSKK